MLLVLLVLTALGLILLENASSDARFAQHEIWRIQAEEIARSGLVYYETHGIPPLVNGKPQDLQLFPRKDQILVVERDGEALRFTGMIKDRFRIRAQASYRVPLWDLSDWEKTQ